MAKVTAGGPRPPPPRARRPQGPVRAGAGQEGQGRSRPRHEHRPAAAEPTAPAPAAAPTAAPAASPPRRQTYYEPGTIIVRFGEATSGASSRSFAIPKLGPLPDDEFPLLVYMGLTKDGKKAKFLVDAAVEVDGDGTCKPHPVNCETIELAVGETEFLDVINPEDLRRGGPPRRRRDRGDRAEVLATFQLDLVDIKRAGDSDVR